MELRDEFCSLKDTKEGSHRFTGYSECGPWTCGIDIYSELARKVEAHSPPQSYFINLTVFLGGLHSAKLCSQGIMVCLCSNWAGVEHQLASLGHLGFWHC